MFNVSAFLQDDAFKQATPVTNGVINEKLRQFSPFSDILQGSVATHLRCGRIFSDCIITNFLLTLTVKQCRKNRLIFNKVKAYKNGANFLGRPVHILYTVSEKDHTIRLSIALPNADRFSKSFH